MTAEKRLAERLPQVQVESYMTDTVTWVPGLSDPALTANSGDVM
jgi:hypothetical protein